MAAQCPPALLTKAEFDRHRHPIPDRSLQLNTRPPSKFELLAEEH
jgi:hypothetical protein